MPLFHPRIIEKHITTLVPPSPDHETILRAWADNLGKGIYDSETQNDSEFIQQIVIGILGYIGSSEGKAWTVAKNQPIGKGNVDVALGNFSTKNFEIIAPFELKGAKTKDLDTIMPGRNKSPVQQAWEYANDAKGVKWVLVSNYREIRLYAFGYGRKNYETFDLTCLAEPKQYARFILLLSANNLLSGNTYALLKESEQKDKEITNLLYQDYKNLRSDLIKELLKKNIHSSPEETVQQSQTILDRILFIAFAEDKSLLPQNTLKSAYDSKNPYNPQPIWTNFQGLFNAIDKGASHLNIPGYNGGLFADNPSINSVNISDEICESFKRIGDYDFDSDVSVNILGHIFEQSISDLEEIKQNLQNGSSPASPKNNKRKKDGIFYTPSYITRHIVEKSVGGWLKDKQEEIGFSSLPKLSDIDYESIKITTRGKNKGKTTFNSKIKEHIDAWENYKDTLSNIKVLDPACGSGAFLNEVFDYLFQEGQLVNSELTTLNGGQTHLFRWDKHILANNIYGVDINPESIEITKLSLWLKTASRDEKLTYLVIYNTPVDAEQSLGCKVRAMLVTAREFAAICMILRNFLPTDLLDRRLNRNVYSSKYL